MFTSSIFYRDDFWKPISDTNNKPNEHGGGGDSAAHHSMFELFLIAYSGLCAGGGVVMVMINNVIKAMLAGNGRKSTEGRNNARDGVQLLPGTRCNWGADTWYTLQLGRGG